jgi:FMN-dependent NADH-azoreductase
MNNQTKTLLRIDASARRENSISRQLGDRLENAISTGSPYPRITKRDVAEGLPFVNEAWIAANFTPDADRTAEHRDALSLSDALVEELKAADTIILTTPIYNFGVPATLKAWIDMIARVGLTFRYTENGPVGLLENKRAYIVIASGGTPIGSDIDYASGYLRHIMGFIGITDVTIIAADQIMKNEDNGLRARAEIDALAVAA